MLPVRFRNRPTGEKRCLRSGDAIYLPSMEPHGMRNISDTEPATFLCCICNVYDRESL